jgi:hypothetical protein
VPLSNGSCRLSVFRNEELQREGESERVSELCLREEEEEEEGFSEFEV